MTKTSPARALWILARPRLLPYVVLLPAFGYGWAHWDRALPVYGATEIWLVLAAWALLHAGTLWINAAQDQDEGEVLMGEAVPVPAIALPAGYLALIATVVLAGLADPVAGAAALVCSLLSVAYSHPRTLWKGHPVLGPVVNGLGYGLLSPMAGWAVVDVGPNPRTLVVWGVGLLGILASYFAAQAFQREEDAARGYRTLVVTHGPRACVQASRALIASAYVIAFGLAIAGWMPRIVLIAAPLGPWIDAWMRRWLHQPDGGGEAWARELARRLLVGGLFVLALVLGEYFVLSTRDVPIAGLGTAAGRPADRPLLPPAAMRRWEAARASNQTPPPP